MNRKLLENREFMKLWLGSTISNLGDSIDNIAIMMLAIKITNSPSAVGLMMMSVSLPSFIFSVIGGGVADNLKRKNIMLYTNIIRGFFIFAILLLVVIEKISFIPLCIILFIVESFSMFYNPAYMAELSNIVDKENFVQARAFSASTQSIVSIVGPSLASVLITIGYAIPLAIDSFSFFFAGIMIYITKFPSNNTPITNVREVFSEKFFHDIKQGFIYLKKNIVLLQVFILIFFINLFLGFFDVALPFFIKQSLKLPVEYYGYFKTMAIGAFMIASLIAVKFKTLRPGKVSIISTFIMGICVFLFGISNYFITSGLFWIIAASARCIIVLMLNSFYGLVVEDKYRGRIIGISTMICASILPISQGLSGLIVDRVSPKWIFIVSGIGLGILSIVYMFNNNLLKYKISKDVVV